MKMSLNVVIMDLGMCKFLFVLWVGTTRFSDIFRSARRFSDYILMRIGLVYCFLVFVVCIFFVLLFFDMDFLGMVMLLSMMVSRNFLVCFEFVFLFLSLGTFVSRDCCMVLIVFLVLVLVL